MQLARLIREMDREKRLNEFANDVDVNGGVNGGGGAETERNGKG